MQNFWRSADHWHRIILLMVSITILAPQSTAVADDEIQRLKQLQSQIQTTVARVMPACVAISDGMGAGSGVIVSPDGLILTAGHVIADSSIFEVILPSGETYKARGLGKNLDIDAGMLQLTGPLPSSLPYVKIGKSKTLKSGQWIVSLGHSGGYEIGRTPPVRTGRILRRSFEQLVTDAVLIGGDSGGPLFNLAGELIGIHSSIGDTVAENRHVTMAAFADSWDRMRNNETWGALPELADPVPAKRRGVIGVRVDLKSAQCRIRVVNPGSPAEQAGVQTDDIVTRFENVPIKDGRHLIEVIKRFNAGDVCKLTVQRNSQQIQFEVQLR